MAYTALSRRKVAVAVPTLFATTELLEAILVHLPQNALLRARRVCHQWDDTVRRSVKAQQKLFKISSQAMSAAIESGTFDYNGSWGYLVNSKYKEDCDAREPWYLTPKPINDAPAHPSRYQLHPRFHYIFHIWISRYSDFSQKAKGGWSDPWRSTLLVQSALYADIVVQIGGRTRRPMSWIVSGKNGAPLTLGDFYDTMEADMSIFDWAPCQKHYLEWEFWIRESSRTEYAVKVLAKLRTEREASDAEHAYREAQWEEEVESIKLAVSLAESFLSSI